MRLLGCVICIDLLVEQKISSLLVTEKIAVYFCSHLPFSSTVRTCRQLLLAIPLDPHSYQSSQHILNHNTRLIIMHRALLCVVITLFGLLSITCAVPLQDYTGTQLVSRSQLTASKSWVTFTVRFPRDPNNQYAVSLSRNRTAVSVDESEKVDDYRKSLFKAVNEGVKAVVTNYFKQKFPDARIVFDPKCPFNDLGWEPYKGKPFHLHLSSVEVASRKVQHLNFVGTMKHLETETVASLVPDDLSGRTPFPTSKEVEAMKRSLVAVRRAEK
ncbi:hypothetical protein GGU11DRAFT_780903 [Lentinula aff. detonsa]|nr:hypothetical protein GGU11DRAFT_780903 [Lentinula aff. detonsa]